MIKVIVNFNIKNNWTKLQIEKIVRVVSQKEEKVAGVVEVNVIGDKEMSEINGRYRGKNYPTDVLSFAWQEDKKIKSKMLGQIYLCFPQVIRQAKEYKISAQEELTRMLSHGLLHLVGYDHQTDTQAKKMFKLQENIIKNLGYVPTNFS